MLKIERSATNADSFRIGGKGAHWVQVGTATPLERYVIEVLRTEIEPGESTMFCLLQADDTWVWNNEEVEVQV